ncbi:uncharacterized protein V1510DRAFT_408531 [Dipodascopsis tothii]|uniref:uncharacterized protein n=1 Tax=Dipodascopsis tothii TaxID=44089 RepID=UPI0034CE35A1
MTSFRRKTALEKHQETEHRAILGTKFGGLTNSYVWQHSFYAGVLSDSLDDSTRLGSGEAISFRIKPSLDLGSLDSASSVHGWPRTTSIQSMQDFDTPNEFMYSIGAGNLGFEFSQSERDLEGSLAHEDCRVPSDGNFDRQLAEGYSDNENADQPELSPVGSYDTEDADSPMFYTSGSYQDSMVLSENARMTCYSHLSVPPSCHSTREPLSALPLMPHLYGANTPLKDIHNSLVQKIEWMY